MIEGRVARVLNDQELIINRGRKDGVTRGMHFDVLRGESPVKIVDPETGEALGVLDRPKAVIRVSEVHEKFALCEPYEVLEIGGSRVAPADFFAPRRRTPASFKGRDVEIAISEDESIIKVGDRVRQWRERRVLKSGEASG